MAAARCPCREEPGPATLTRSGSSSGVEDGRGWAIWEEGKAKGKDDQLTIYLEVPGYPQIWHPCYAVHYSAVAVRTEKEDAFSTQSYQLPTRSCFMASPWRLPALSAAKQSLPATNLCC